MMPSTQDTFVRKSTSLDALTETSKKINSATKRLNVAVDQFNSALKGLNLGVPVWIVVCSGEPNNQIIETEELGYAKVKGRWGVCIRLTIEGLGPEPEERHWHFEDAPRDMRIHASSHFNKLLIALNEASLQAAQSMEQSAIDVEEMSDSIVEAANNAIGRATLRPRPVVEAK
jgi:hypothetical protein